MNYVYHKGPHREVILEGDTVERVAGGASQIGYKTQVFLRDGYWRVIHGDTGYEDTYYPDFWKFVSHAKPVVREKSRFGKFLEKHGI